MLLMNNFFLVLVMLLMNFSDLFDFKLILSNLLSQELNIEMSMDKKSEIFGLILLTIVFSITLFKNYYLSEEKNMFYFNIIFFWFVVSMMFILISQNFILMILAWDMLGVSSYLLIIFYNNTSSKNSGMTTTNTNRFGDMFLMTFIVICLNKNFISFNMKWEFFSFFLLVCLMTKSAQFPFSSWLPLAMAAPTPVSSLVHSSTLVTAGLFIFYKTDILFYNKLFLILFVLSLWTNIFSGLMASLEMDMKKMIALSTLSQISFMSISLTLGLIYLSFLHLLSHAIFKASLFFWAGMKMHSTKNEQFFIYFNNKSMKMSQYFLMVISFSLIGFPMSLGFYSKDQIIDILKPNFSFISNMILIFSIFLTVIYTIRLIKKMSCMNFNKFNYKSMYINNINSFIVTIVFSILLSINKMINEIYFKSSFILVSSGWKNLFLISLMAMTAMSWKMMYLIYLSSIFKMNFLNYFTMKMTTSIIVKKNIKSIYFDFGWTDKMNMTVIKKLMSESKKIDTNKKLILMLMLCTMFVCMCLN